MNAQVAELGRAGVATVYEAYGRRGLLEQEWQTITPGRRVAGSARTVLCGDGDNRAVHEAMDQVQPGEIVVVTMQTPAPVAVVGDLLATQAAARGAVGMVIDAAVRDAAEIAGGPLAVLARWRNARGATRVERGTVGLPITVGGVQVATGDVVILDDDGATSVQVADVAAVVESVRARISKEAALRARWANGELSYDVYGLRDEDLRRSTAL